ncbi:MAG: EAL domain-containing protein, partial [Gammaproteobacteria bacterium]
MPELLPPRKLGNIGSVINQSVQKSLFHVLLTSFLYYAAGKFTLPLSLPPSYATAIWPPAGIGLAATLLWGFRVLPGILLGEFLIHYEVYDISKLWESPPEVLVFFLNPFNSVARAWLGCVLVRKFAGYPNELISTRRIVLFFLIAGPVATLFPAILSVSGLLYNNVIIREDFLYAFLTWWLGDCIGIAVFTPLFFIVFDRSSRIWRERILTVGLPLALMFLTTAMAYLLAQQHETQRLQRVIDYRTHHIKQAVENQFRLQLTVLNVYRDVAERIAVEEGRFKSVSQALTNRLPDTTRLIWLESVNEGGNRHLSTHFSISGPSRQSADFDSNTVLKKANILISSPRITADIGTRDFLIMVPVQDHGEPGCNCIKGVVAGIFNIDRFIRDILDANTLNHLIIEMSAFPDNKQERLIFQSSDRKNHSNPLRLYSKRSINLGPMQWQVTVTPDNQFLGENYSWSVWQLLAGGMFLTSFTSISLLVLTGHTASVRIEVERRTEELKMINSRLAASEQQFRKLVHTQSAIVWRAEPQTMKFLFVNDEAESLLGYPVREWLDDSEFCQKHIHRDDYEKTKAFCVEMNQSPVQDGNEIEFRMIAADGRCVWLRNFIDVSVENGELIEFFGFMIDITEQKQAEEQLRLAATTFESQQGIMITDKNAKILRVNKAFTEITGYSQEHIEGKNPRLLQSGQHDGEFFQHFWNQLESKGRYEGEIWNRRINGEIYPQWQTVTAVKNDSGKITHYVSVFSDITEKKTAETKIHALAYYDPLTNLPNRRLLLDRFDHEITIAQRHQKFGAVIFLDLDHFKVLNDTQGHLVGDELLIQVASRLSSVLRKEDTPARIGGDEFVVLLHAESDSLPQAAEHTRTVAEKIREKLNEPFLLNQYLHRLSPSIGIALFPDHCESPDKILQQADIAMYRSKTNGRNTISFFHPTMQQASDARLQLEQNLRTAVEKGRFLLHYQPQINENGEAFGAEALIRWNHPEKGLLAPGEFISIAEESSIILDIGSWVLNEACRQIKTWLAAGYHSPHISININAHQFRQKDFVRQVEEAVRNSGISPDLLGIELTESLMIDDIEEAIAKMMALKKLGIAIAIDDFGTGYSSLMYLKRLPIDVLKIDRLFI